MAALAPQQLGDQRATRRQRRILAVRCPRDREPLVRLPRSSEEERGRSAASKVPGTIEVAEHREPLLRVALELMEPRDHGMRAATRDDAEPESLRVRIIHRSRTPRAAAKW